MNDASMSCEERKAFTSEKTFEKYVTCRENQEKTGTNGFVWKCFQVKRRQRPTSLHHLNKPQTSGTMWTHDTKGEFGGQTQKSQQSWNCLVIKNCQSFSIKMSVMDKVMQESSSWCWWRRCWSSRTTFLYVWTFSNKDSANPNDFLLMDTFQPQFQP